MTGGGGGGGTSTGGGTDRGGECLPIYKGAGLASPKRSVLSKLSVGDILTLEAVQQGVSYVLYASHSGERAGSVTHASLAQIIKCILEGGHTYVGVITALDGGSVSLEIRMAT